MHMVQIIGHQLIVTNHTSENLSNCRMNWREKRRYRAKVYNCKKDCSEKWSLSGTDLAFDIKHSCKLLILVLADYNALVNHDIIVILKAFVLCIHMGFFTYQF